MCDYSLEMYGSRPAREGELYVTTRFPSGSIGFASAGDPRTAVCMQCDTKVMLTNIPVALQNALRIGAEAETLFAQREAGLYRDGLRLADGRFVSLQDLQPGIHAYVPALLERDGLKGLALLLICSLIEVQGRGPVAFRHRPRCPHGHRNIQTIK